MSGNLDWTSVTNIQNQSCSIADCGCIKMWEILQQQVIKYLSNSKNNKNDYKLEPGYEARARRCAAIYAQIYLEKLNGKPDMMGRYYWIGLGVFASKTVAAVFNDIITQSGFESEQFIKLISQNKYSMDDWGLGVSGVHSFAKGNLWLFMDIAVWHLAWNASPKSFEACHGKRNTENYVHIKKAFNNLPWVSCTSKIENLGSTAEIREAFFVHLEKVEKFLNNVSKSRKENFSDASSDQFKHLIAIAKQEQWNILQKIVWNEVVVQDGSKSQREYGIPKAQLILSSDYNYQMPMTQYIRNHKIQRSTAFSRKIAHLSETPVSLPPQGTKVEDYDSRMKWINLAAEKYHRLMQSDEGREFLEKEIKVIATWDKSKWGDSKFDSLFRKISKDSNDGKGG